MFWFLHSGKRRIFHRMGFYADQKGIIRRYRREKLNWESHLQHTQQFILSHLPDGADGRIAILGSGWLLDVPYKDLLDRFSEIHLFDVYHPQPAQKLARKFNQIKLIETDISGFALPLHNLVKVHGENIASYLPKIKPSFDFHLSSYDCIVSCNIFNQLDILLIDFLKDKCCVDSFSENLLRQNIQEAHLSLLPTNKSLFISDIEEYSVDEHDRVISSNPLNYSNCKFPNEKNEWIWKFDNHYTYNDKNKTWFKVVAFTI